jgi:hypothetical protein
MGVDVANGGGMGHGHGTSPATGDLEIWCHWGNKSIDEATAISAADFSQLMEDSEIDQATFDSTAGALASWYAFSGLSAAEKAEARRAVRKGFAMLADLS